MAFRSANSLNYTVAFSRILPSVSLPVSDNSVTLPLPARAQRDVPPPDDATCLDEFSSLHNETLLKCLNFTTAFEENISGNISNETDSNSHYEFYEVSIKIL